jgi:hypothetical protein
VLIALKPNPFSDIVQIDIQDATESLSINVYNAVGKLVYQSQTQPGQSTHRIATEQWTEGMYIIQVGNHTQKVIKTNND